MAVTSFAFAKLVVNDSDALKRFYTDSLGLSAGLRNEEGEGADAFVENFLSVGTDAPRVVLMSYPNRPAPPAGEVVIALNVDDVDAKLAAVEQDGGRIAMPAFDIPQYGLRMAYAVDPEGHMIELLQMG